MVRLFRESKFMKIKSHLKQYEVIIEENLNFLEELIQVNNVKFVIDKNVYELYGSKLKKINEEDCILIEATEENKIIETALKICEKLTEIPAKRNSTLISIGGGIIQDITGFVANITYRGINWIFVPTTLLSACDSCIGGKTSLNYKKYKNLLGTFYPPDEIHICSDFFKSLSERDYKSGLGEIIKFNIMAGEKKLHNIEDNIDKLLKRDGETIHKFVMTSLNFKKDFIEVDEFDKGERIKLNFAHTFGHAIEVITEYEIPHGTAVAIGMIMADHISYKRGFLSEKFIGHSEKILLKVIDINIKCLEKPLEEYIIAIKKDKKQVDDSLTAVLISNYGEKGELSVVHDIEKIEIKNAVSHFIKLYKARG